MAGVSGRDGLESGGASPLSRLARAQYAALLKMRWLVLTHGARSLQGRFELSSRGVGTLFYGLIGLGTSGALGVTANLFARHGEWRLEGLLFWVVLAIWQSVPVGLASFQTQFEMGSLLRFPVSFWTFFVLHLVFAVGDLSTILGGLWSAGLLVGIVTARGDLALWALAAVVLFAIFNILLVRVILLWLDKWLARRRTRELIGGVFVTVLLSLQLLNPALRPEREGKPSIAARQHRLVHSRGERLAVASGVVLAAQTWLPPGQASAALSAGAQRKTWRALAGLGGLCFYAALAAGLLAVRLGAEFRGESLGEVEPSGERERREESWLLSGGGPMAAVMEKELRTMVRSMPLLYAVGAPLFMVIVLSNLFWSNASGVWKQSGFALPGCLAYALMGVSQLLYNTMGSDGTGVRIIFLSPTPVRTVILAKNLFHGLTFAVVAGAAWVLTSLRTGWPNQVMAAATVAWLLFALPASLTIGNVFSLVMPHRIHLGKLARQRGSAASSLISLFVQVLLLAVAATVFWLSARAGKLWLAAPVFLALAVVATFMWFRVFGQLETMAGQRKDLLISTLSKTD